MDFKVDNNAGTIVYSIIGDASQNIYVGGNFQQVGESNLNYYCVAKYDYYGNWHSLNYNNSSHTIYSLALDASNVLYAGTSVGLRYCNLNNGQLTWTTVQNTGTFIIYKILMNSNNNIYIGGTFSFTSGQGQSQITCNNIAIYNKITGLLSPLGTGLTHTTGGSTPSVVSMVLDGNNNLYVGGNFDHANGSGADNIAKWNGTAWAQVDGGITHSSAQSQGKNAVVNSLAFTSDYSQLYVGGNFDKASGVSISDNIVIYNVGTNTWTNLPQGLGLTTDSSDCVHKILLDNSNVYAFGTFDTSLNNMAQRTNNTWTALGYGVSHTTTKAVIYTAYKSNGNIFIGGNFTNSNNTTGYGNIGIYSLSGNTIGKTYFDTLTDANASSQNLTTYLGNNLNRIKFNLNQNAPNKFKQNIRNNYNKFPQNSSSDVSWVDISGIFSTIDNTFNGNDFRFVLLKNTATNSYTINLSQQNYYYFPLYQSNDTLKINIDGSDYDISYNNTQIYFGGIGHGASNEVIALDPNNLNRTMTIRGIGSGGVELHCLTDMCDVLTPNGYINVRKLNIGDYVITEDNREVQIKRITSDIYIPDTETYPYLVKKSSISKNYPSENILLSRRHLIKYNDKWYVPEKIGTIQTHTTYVHYYHIELENYTTDNLIINNGTVVESLTSEDIKYVERDAIEWHKRYNSY